MLNEPKTSRPKPRPEPRGRGRGQFLEVEDKAEPKNNYEKVPNNDSTYDLRLLPEKLTKFPNFTRFLPEKKSDYIIRQRDRGQAEAKCLRPSRGRGRDQSFEAKAEAKILASRPLWPRGLNITAKVVIKGRFWCIQSIIFPWYFLS